MFQGINWLLCLIMWSMNMYSLEKILEEATARLPGYAVPETSYFYINPFPPRGSPLISKVVWH